MAIKQLFWKGFGPKPFVWAKFRLTIASAFQFVFPKFLKLLERTNGSRRYCPAELCIGSDRFHTVNRGNVDGRGQDTLAIIAEGQGRQGRQRRASGQHVICHNNAGTSVRGNLDVLHAIKACDEGANYFI